ncbi:MAG: shikimate dehydrogenase, partial [Candidatus Latescibacteria bacterium]|nr:shikimate dehydrogenase [Candidatus Latescibacterota bacterium]
HLDRVTREAKAVGAVNTVLNRDGELVGENTDVFGILMCLQKEGGLERLPERVCILGAGGAARGVVYACARRFEVEEIVVVNRTLSKAESLASELADVTRASIKARPADEETFSTVIPAAGLIVNTTSVGMHPGAGDSPVPDPAVFREGQTVCDIIYNPLETRLLREASARGAKTVGGLAMLAYQGARSLSLWTHREAPVDVMLDALKEAMKSSRE